METEAEQDENMGVKLKFPAKSGHRYSIDMILGKLLTTSNKSAIAQDRDESSASHETICETNVVVDSKDPTPDEEESHKVADEETRLEGHLGRTVRLCLFALFLIWP